MSRSKLLIVGAFPPKESKVVGGIVTACKRLIESDFSKKFDLVLVDSTQISNPAPNVVVRGLLALRRVLIYFKKIAIEKPDGVILFVAGEASIVEKGSMAWVTRLFGIPVFVFPRGARIIEEVKTSKVHRLWIPFMFRGATHFLCQGKSWHKFATNVVGFSEENTCIVANWTATDELLSIGENRAFDTTDDVVEVLFLGWLEKSKGVFDLLEACCRIKDLDFVMTIAGRGRTEVDLKEFVLAKKMESKVKFAGWVDGPELTKLLNGTDVFVLPSWAEGLPNAMIEAMAAKVAVVVTSVGMIPNYVTHGLDAILIEPKNIDQLEQALRLVITKKLTREFIAMNGYILAKEEFGVSKGVKTLSNYIAKAIEE